MKKGYQKFFNEMKQILEEQKSNIKDDDEYKEMKLQALKANANAFAMYVKKECEQNADFDEAVAAEWKSAKRMLAFVEKKAKVLAVGQVACVADHMVYDWVSEYYFLDDKEKVEAEMKAETEKKARIEAEVKAKAERRAKAEAEAKAILAEDEEYKNSDEKGQAKLLKAKTSELEKKIERKEKADAKKAQKAAEERAKAIKRLEDAGSLTESTSEAEKEKMIEQTIKKLRKEEKEAKKKAKEEKAKKEAEKDTSIEANAPTTKTEDAKSEEKVEEKVEAEAKPESETKVEATSEAKAESTDYGKLSDKLDEPDCKQVAEAVEKYGEAKTVSMTELSLLDKAKALLAKCDADKVVALYKKSSVEEMTERELDNLVSHEEQVLAKFALV